MPLGYWHTQTDSRFTDENIAVSASFNGVHSMS
jgi:hypothetical protein